MFLKIKTINFIEKLNKRVYDRLDEEPNMKSMI